MVDCADDESETETSRMELHMSDRQIEKASVTIIRQSTFLACPHVIMMPSHYRPDGSCKCNDPAERAMMIREWGYSRSDFA